MVFLTAVQPCCLQPFDRYRMDLVKQDDNGVRIPVEPPVAPKKKRQSPLGQRRVSDRELAWVARDYPELDEWRALAAGWISGETEAVHIRLSALVVFLEKYLIHRRLPLHVSVFLSRQTLLPDFYSTCCPASNAGVAYNNIIHGFLNWVLLRDFSETADDGAPVVSPAFRNPVPKKSRSGQPKLDESVHSPLPYGYIDELRRILASGPNFKDWIWAHTVSGPEIGKQGVVAPDWFPVTEDDVDNGDPDCVWRWRPRAHDPPVLEMWSPVRWVALLTKLILPLRTMQVRMLDSGEADTWRFSGGAWSLNEGALAESTPGSPLQNGVFRRHLAPQGDAVTTVIYVNTNKTADRYVSGAVKGYLLPWPADGEVHQRVLYWLEKLRNWQEKFNPVLRRTSWTEMDGRYLQAKSDVQLAGYSDACFLFRTPESPSGQARLPVTDAMLNRAWFYLLRALEQRLSIRIETHADGAPIHFLPRLVDKSIRTLFPLHSLRVSLITALALDGNVPFPILQKLVGHSRLLMTPYYTKPGAARIREQLSDAARRLETSKERSIQHFLMNTEHQTLVTAAISNCSTSLSAALPVNALERNAAGWMPMHHGLCLVGGNTSEVEGYPVGGCHNGGPNIGNSSNPNHAAVPGGARNCVRCRWFVTEPHYLPALAAHFNTIAYHFDEARNLSLARDDALQALRIEKIDAEDGGGPFSRMVEYRQAERLWEGAMSTFSELAESLVACYRLIERCQHALSGGTTSGSQIVAGGSLVDVRLAFEQTESELRQLAGICEDAEVYPDLEPGKAVLRRSQLLDAALYREKLPPVFLMLSEHDQLIQGNALMRKLAHQARPENPALGRVEVIRLIDAGEAIGKRLGMALGAIRGPAFPIPLERNAPHMRNLEEAA